MGALDVHGLSDAALVARVSRSSRDALAELYRRHAGPVHGVARRMLRESALADEVVQEVFLTLWRVPDRFDPDRGSLRAYLLTQAHARAVDMLRAEAARRRREEREWLGRPEPVDDDVEREVLGRTRAGEVRGVLASLPETERQAIALAYFGGRTYREVAKLLGQPEGTVKSRIRAGLERMREALSEEQVSGA